ncbi:hypothetical protein ACE193_01600 [Bernardetia sp. OM2101]
MKIILLSFFFLLISFTAFGQNLDNSDSLNVGYIFNENADLA